MVAVPACDFLLRVYFSQCQTKYDWNIFISKNKINPFYCTDKRVRCKQTEYRIKKEGKQNGNQSNKANCAGVDLRDGKGIFLYDRLPGNPDDACSFSYLRAKIVCQSMKKMGEFFVNSIDFPEHLFII